MATARNMQSQPPSVRAAVMRMASGKPGQIQRMGVAMLSEKAKHRLRRENALKARERRAREVRRQNLYQKHLPTGALTVDDERLLLAAYGIRIKH